MRVVSVLVLVAVLFILNVFRIRAGGIRNLVSPSYWATGITGKEFYYPETGYFRAGNRKRREVCFTFDDGPNGASCEPILKILKAGGVHATFFLIGQRIKAYPDLTREILADGNEVGNHTMHHPRLDTITTAQVEDELKECEAIFESTTHGAHMYLFRPPGERMNDGVLAVAKQMGYTTVGWQIGAQDYTGGGADSLQVLNDVKKQLKPGAIILLHDSPLTASVLADMIQAVKDQGYKTVTVTQMLRDLPDPVDVPTNAR